MIKQLERILKRAAIVGGLTLAGVSFYSGENFSNYFTKDKAEKSFGIIESPLTSAYFTLVSDNYFKSAGKFTSFEKAKEQYEKYKSLELEDKLKIIEKERLIEEEILRMKYGFYLTEDSLTVCIKQAYANVKKWPKEFDKRLFRLMIRQESGRNIYAVSSAEAIGISQIAFIMYETLRPLEYEMLFRNQVTGDIDSAAVKKELFKPVKNLELSLEALCFFSNYCKKHYRGWKDLDIEEKRIMILACYNAGLKWNLDSKKLPKETKKYYEAIMAKYHNLNIKIKT